MVEEDAAATRFISPVNAKTCAIEADKGDIIVTAVTTSPNTSKKSWILLDDCSVTKVIITYDDLLYQLEA